MNNPLIVTNSGGMPEIVGNVATIVNRENLIKELEIAIMKYYKDNKNIEKYDSMVEKFGIDKYCENFEKYIKDSTKMHK